MADLIYQRTCLGWSQIQWTLYGCEVCFSLLFTCTPLFTIFEFLLTQASNSWKQVVGCSHYSCWGCSHSPSPTPLPVPSILSQTSAPCVIPPRTLHVQCMFMPTCRCCLCLPWSLTLPISVSVQFSVHCCVEMDIQCIKLDHSTSHGQSMRIPSLCSCTYTILFPPLVHSLWCIPKPGWFLKVFVF